MEKTEFILASTDKGEAVEKIGNINLNINFDEGIININGQKSVLDALGKSHNTTLNTNSFNIRMKELLGQSLMDNEPEEVKNKREAKIAIYAKLLSDFKKATEKAVIELDKL